MITRTTGWIALCAVLAGCGLAAQPTLERTLMGVTRHQAFVAAHRTLAAESFEFDVADAETGTLVTAWRDSATRSVRYEVTTRAAASAPGGAGVSATSVEVRAQVRDRAVRGWTAGYPAPSDGRSLLEQITRAAPEVPGAEPVAPAAAQADPPPPPATEPPACTASRQCPPGQHCGSGRCVWECATDDECEGDRRCDRRGRCVTPPPQPLPPTVSPEPEPPAGAE